MWFKFSQNKIIQKTIYKIIAIYLTTTILLLLSISYIYLQHQYKQILQVEKSKIDTLVVNIIDDLEALQDDIVDGVVLYPRYDGIKTAIYDIDNNKIFSTFDQTITTFDRQYFDTKDFRYFIYKIHPYYLGARYLVVESKKSYTLNDEIKKIVFVVLIIVLFLVFTSFLIAYAIVKPLSDNITTLDKFIKDTTHELNTPLSAISSNIEMLENTKMDDTIAKKFHRIKIASTTISNIYNDLSFLLLNNKQKNSDEDIDISALLKERIEYFKILTDLKNIKIQSDIEDEIVLKIDRQKAIRLFDNLLSNSIKYSNSNNKIKITLKENIFIIEDFGIGMSDDEIKNIFTRYKRFNNSVGGFGIGYDIINSIITQYNINIDIHSKKNQGTKVVLKW